MEINKMVNKINKVKLNISYIKFLEKVKKEKLLSMESKKVRELYKGNVKIKSVLNIDRVNKRVFREELKGVIEKNSELKYKDLKEIGEKLVIKVRNKENNYIEC